MIFGSYKKLIDLKSLDIPSIILGNSVIPLQQNARNLGVILSCDLTWNDHVSKITCNINYVLKNLYNNINSIPRKVKIDLIAHLALPHFDYACLVYDSLTGYLDNKLQNLQNRCIRFIFSLKKGTSITPFRRQLRWLTVKSRRKYFLGLSVFKILRYKKPLYLYIFFDNHFSITTRTLRPTTHQIFDPPLATNKTYESSYHIQAMTLWNKLPQSIRNSESEQIFKNRIFNYFFAQDKQ